MYLQLVLTLHNILFLTSICVLILQLKYLKKIIETIKHCLKINNAYKILRLDFKENHLNLGVIFLKSLGSVTFYVFRSSFFS